jgi:hypothetical protein
MKEGRLKIEMPDIAEALDSQYDALSDILAVLGDIRDHLAAIRDNTDKITS